MEVFVIVSTYRAKVGEDDAIIALHEDLQRSQDLKAKAYLSWELLRKVDAPREFIAIAYFSSEELAKAAESDLEQDAWYGRLVSLIEEGTLHTACISEWRLPGMAQMGGQRAQQYYGLSTSVVIPALNEAQIFSMYYRLFHPLLVRSSWLMDIQLMILLQWQSNSSRLFESSNRWARVRETP